MGSPEESEEKQVILSVRFPVELLGRGKAVAEIIGISFNELVRKASAQLLQNKAGDPTFAAKADEYVAKAVQDVKVAFDGEIPPEILAALNKDQPPIT